MSSWRAHHGQPLSRAPGPCRRTTARRSAAPRTTVADGNRSPGAGRPGPPMPPSWRTPPPSARRPVWPSASVRRWRPSRASPGRTSSTRACSPCRRTASPTARSPGRRSTSASSSSRRTRTCPCWRGCSSCRSSPRTSTSSSWCGSPASSAGSPRHGDPALPGCAPPGARDDRRGRPQLMARHARVFLDQVRPHSPTRASPGPLGRVRRRASRSACASTSAGRSSPS